VITDVTQDRESGLGGSDIAAVVGLSPYATAHDVWAQKVGLAPRIVETEPMHWGHKLEELIASHYAATRGVDLDTSPRLYHRKGKWAFGSPDRLVRGARRGLEIKNVGFTQAHLWGEEGTDQIPDHYIPQTQWYLEITEYDDFDVPVLLGGNQFRVYNVKRDPEFGAALLEQGERFWIDHVLARKPPPVDGSESAKRMLSLLYPRDKRPMLASTPDMDHLAHELANAREHRLGGEQAEAEIAAKLKELIGDAAGIIGCGYKIHWKSTKDRTVTAWEDLARSLLNRLPQDEVGPLVAKHVKTISTRPFRPVFDKEDGE
jgi:putative phage-type endonuclease